MQRICVDMDEVMADTLAEHIRRYNQAFDEAVTTEDLAGKGLWEIAPQDRQAELRAFLDAEDFFEELDVIPDAQPVLKDLSSRFEIFIATQAMAVPNSLGPKYRWLQRHFPFIPPTHYVFCGNKTHPPRRLPHRRPAQESHTLRRPGTALHRAAQSHSNRLCPREQLARSCRLFQRSSHGALNTRLAKRKAVKPARPQALRLSAACKTASNAVRYHEL